MQRLITLYIYTSRCGCPQQFRGTFLSCGDCAPCQDRHAELTTLVSLCISICIYICIHNTYIYMYKFFYFDFKQILVLIPTIFLRHKISNSWKIIQLTNFWKINKIPMFLLYVYSRPSHKLTEWTVFQKIYDPPRVCVKLLGKSFPIKKRAMKLSYSSSDFSYLSIQFRLHLRQWS